MTPPQSRLYGTTRTTGFKTCSAGAAVVIRHHHRRTPVVLWVFVQRFRNSRATCNQTIDWLQTVERIFDLRDVPDNLKVKLVAIKLIKHASLWWEHVQNQRYREGKHKVESWDKIK
ncbi:hypothetical protein HanLR1_Chr14g0513271 [Helianthus annuus]|nr:hypothetical protein HanHA89_Chr14g0544001 [Helianthus annuus]KAJ0654983.1 hypothetical protein HanLR1_Chr14g0513271 [Helianthus annuus]